MGVECDKSDRSLSQKWEAKEPSLCFLKRRMGVGISPRPREAGDGDKAPVALSQKRLRQGGEKQK